MADIVLTTAARETSLRSGATASRIAALTVVDCLYIAVAHRDLERATRAVSETRRPLPATTSRPSVMATCQSLA
jgi:DNA-binding MurR/RpiR family transcriptional regulator